MAWICFVTLVDENDPLASTPVADFLDSHGKLWSTYGRSHETLWSSLGTVLELERDAGPGLGMLRSLFQPNLAPLWFLLPPVLVAQLFRRRKAAWVVLLAMTVLYAGAIDRMALGMALRNMEDGQADVVTRLEGCRRAAGTFFWRDTAARRMAGVARDPDAPPELREMAEEAAEALGEFPGVTPPRFDGDGTQLDA